jgi:DNA-binding transcriptional LysR family regulator
MAINRSFYFEYSYNVSLWILPMPLDTRIRRRLKLRELDTLIAVAEAGSMAKAAARLSVSQPAVSKAIADLERTLGYRLLDRTVKGVEPTSYGHALLRWAQAVFDDIQQGVAEIEFLADPTVGELRIGATEPIIAGLLPVILERLRRQHPRMTFRVIQMAATPEQSQALRGRQVDLVLGRILRSTDEDMNTEILFYERTFVVSGAGDRKRPRRKVAISDLLQKWWAPLQLKRSQPTA